MSRPTTIEHPIVTLRSLTELGRQQFARYLGIAAVTLEKVERGERGFTPQLMDRLFQETGVCPGWLNNPTTPIHTADGHPYTSLEWARWRAWKESKVPAELLPNPGSHGVGGRLLGPHYSRTCCPGPQRLLAHAELHSQTLSKGQIRSIQADCKTHELRELAVQLIDLARGAANQAFANRDTDSLLKAMHALRKIFPEAKPTPDPRDAEAAAEFIENLRQIASQKPHPSPSPATGAPPRIQRNRKKRHK